MDATIALVAKFKLAKGRSRSGTPRPQGGLPCVILVILAMFLVGLFIFYAVTHANG